ncbi:hypothetical protein CLV58_11928 [Spirosoma oryzae]|uniref:Uncharacterized protein n=1 Tax=Spirosoma oryzae TaxID=1469603 RepID=A0A2T0SKE6_9BACT|nr:hypothetical protein [Spirosoma oryzae]PRY33879.1 hypothetical protein CLV58_11928 [Spirosoma oryzae]
MQQLNVGDWVVCVDYDRADQLLIENKLYKIRDVRDDNWIKVYGVDYTPVTRTGFISCGRFKPVDSFQLKVLQAKQQLDEQL